MSPTVQSPSHAHEPGTPRRRSASISGGPLTPRVAGGERPIVWGSVVETYGARAAGSPRFSKTSADEGAEAFMDPFDGIELERAGTREARPRGLSVDTAAVDSDAESRLSEGIIRTLQRSATPRRGSPRPVRSRSDSISALDEEGCDHVASGVLTGVLNAAVGLAESEDAKRDAPPGLADAVDTFHAAVESGHIEPPMWSRGGTRRHSTITFNTLIYAHCCSGDMDAAEAATIEMREAGFSPDLATYNALIEGWCRLDDLAAAEAVVPAMVKAGVLPTGSTYGILANANIRLGDTERAEKIMTAMVANGIFATRSGWDNLIRGWCVQSEMTRAEEAAAKMRDAGFPPSASTWTVLVRGWCNVGNCGRAEELVEQMMAEDKPPTSYTYNALVKGWCDRRCVERAYEVVQTMERVGLAPDVISWASMVKGFCDVGDMLSASQMYVRVKERGIAPTNALFNSIIKGWCDSNNMGKAALMKEEMLSCGLRPDVVTQSIILKVRVYFFCLHILLFAHILFFSTALYSFVCAPSSRDGRMGGR
jgi:pentatricopeptide repeat protein